jgi:hypothetical protein
MDLGHCRLARRTMAVLQVTVHRAARPQAETNECATIWERANKAWILCILGEITGHQSPPADALAEDSYREALVLAEPRGMRPLVAHCHLGLGKLYRRTGKRELAHEHLTTATTMYREMGMTYWLEKAEAEIKDVAR